MDTQKENGTLKSNWNFYAGILFTVVIAIGGYLLAFLPFFKSIGPLASAILLAVLYRQVFGYPEGYRTGIQFVSKRILRLAIILYGLKLNLDIVFHQGLGLLAKGAFVIIFSMLMTYLLAKLLKADSMLSLLGGVGTGVCGAAAIAAVSPIVKSKEEDTAIGVGIIALIGTIFSVLYTLLLPVLPMTKVQYGIWSGLSLHELAHVALAAAPAGSDGLAIALLAKLGRVFLLVPLCFILMYWFKRKGKEEVNSKVEFPWFLLGFVLLSFLGTYVLADFFKESPQVVDGIAKGTTFLLTTAMVGLGVNISLRDLRTKALRPLIVVVLTSVLLSVVTYFISK